MNTSPEQIETDPIESGFRRLKQLVGFAIVVCLLAASGSALASYFVARSASDSRQQICDRVITALDVVIDNASRAQIPPGATDAEIAEILRKTEAFKVQYHSALATCD